MFLQESVEKINNLKLKFLQRAFHSRNDLVKELFLVVDKMLHLGMWW